MSGSLKWVLGGSLLGLALSSVVFFSIPGSVELSDVKAKSSDTDYNRSIYGVPVLDMEHYRVGEDKYLSYMLDNKFSVGKENPSSESKWFKDVKNNPELLTMLDELKKDISSAKTSGEAIQDTLGSEAEKAAKAKAEAEKAKAEAEAKAELENNDNGDTANDGTLLNGDSSVTIDTSTGNIVDKGSYNYKTSVTNTLDSFSNLFSEYDPESSSSFKSKGNEFINTFVTELEKNKSALSDDVAEGLLEISDDFSLLLNAYLSENKTDIKSLSNSITDKADKLK